MLLPVCCPTRPPKPMWPLPVPDTTTAENEPVMAPALSPTRPPTFEEDPAAATVPVAHALVTVQPVLQAPTRAPVDDPPVTLTASSPTLRRAPLALPNSPVLAALRLMNRPEIVLLLPSKVAV